MTASRPDAAAVLDVFADLVADRVAARLAAACTSPAGWVALPACARRIGWTPRRLREFCLLHDVAVRGRGRAQLVDVAALDAAIAALPTLARAVPDGPSANDDDTREAAMLSRAGLRLAPGARSDGT